MYFSDNLVYFGLSNLHWGPTGHLDSSIYEPRHDKTNKVTVRPAKTLIRVFAVRMKKVWALSYPMSAQRRLCSDWEGASNLIRGCIVCHSVYTFWTHSKNPKCSYWPRLQNQFGPDQILIGPRSGPNLVM